LPRKTNSSNPADWLYLSESDLRGICELAHKELAYELCRSKLAEVIEKLMKAELLRLGWILEKTHDLQNLAAELQIRGSDLVPALRPLATGYAEVYFMARYPGFDLEDPDWAALREDVNQVSELLLKIKSRVPGSPGDPATTSNLS
jgi:HEPN domain-containing protein